jgi:hypothetical protein
MTDVRGLEALDDIELGVLQYKERVPMRWRAKHEFAVREFLDPQ